jgi:hypothetical protein
MSQQGGESVVKSVGGFFSRLLGGMHSSFKS